MKRTTILLGVVGSHAYGLHREGSDYDRLGVFVAPTLEVAGLDWHSNKESIVDQGPDGDDFAMHEVGKFCRLALKVNPTITELLWLDEYEKQEVAGFLLEGIRESFLSAPYVKNAYLGYARSQLDKFHHGDFKRKHARHCLRLLRQGVELLETGQLTVKVPDPQTYFDMDEMTNGQVIEVLTNEFKSFDEKLLTLTSPLPQEPDRKTVSEFLEDVRASHMF